MEYSSENTKEKDISSLRERVKKEGFGKFENQSDPLKKSILERQFDERYSKTTPEHEIQIQLRKGNEGQPQVKEVEGKKIEVQASVWIIKKDLITFGQGDAMKYMLGNDGKWYVESFSSYRQGTGANSTVDFWDSDKNIRSIEPNDTTLKNIFGDNLEFMKGFEKDYKNPNYVKEDLKKKFGLKNTADIGI